MKIILDGKKLANKEKLHKTLKVNLQLSNFYGENLDALWDELSSRSDDIHITLTNSSDFKRCLGNYADLVINLFEELDMENENIKFLIKS